MMETYENAANLFIAELKKRGKTVKPTILNRRILLHLEEPTPCSELVVSVTPTFKSAEIEITRTLVSKRRVFNMEGDLEGQVVQAADAFFYIYGKLEGRETQRRLRNEEIDMASLPFGVGLTRQPDGSYNVSFERNMSLGGLKKLIEVLKGL